MLFCNIGEAEKYDYLQEKFRVAYKWLQETDLEGMPVGKYPLMGDDVIANVQEYTTKPAEEKRFETHEKFYDIQYIVAGEEMIGICKRDGLTETQRKSESDVIFYADPELTGWAYLKAGDLVVVAPEDAHKPGCIAKEAMPVKKVVVKIKI